MKAKVHEACVSPVNFEQEESECVSATAEFSEGKSRILVWVSPTAANFVSELIKERIRLEEKSCDAHKMNASLR